MRVKNQKHSYQQPIIDFISLQGETLMQIPANSGDKGWGNPVVDPWG